MRRRERVRLVVCILLLFACVAAVGATCVICVSNHPGQTIERTLPSLPTASLPPDAMWSFVLLLAFVSQLLVRSRFLSLGRASPAELQRFLF